MLGTLNKLQQIRSQIQAAATPKPAPTPQPTTTPIPAPKPAPGAKTSSIPHTLKTTQDLDLLIAQLETLREQLAEGSAITLTTDH
jgi:hypothetical protein